MRTPQLVYHSESPLAQPCMNQIYIPTLDSVPFIQPAYHPTPGHWHSRCPTYNTTTILLVTTGTNESLLSRLWERRTPTESHPMVLVGRGRHPFTSSSTPVSNRVRSTAYEFLMATPLCHCSLVTRPV